MRLIIKPMYGYGWFHKAKTILTPAPFEVDGKMLPGDEAIGIITEEGLSFSDGAFHASSRHKSSSGTYNCTIYSPHTGPIFGYCEIGLQFE